VPPLVDTSILEWQDDYLGADTNLPQDGSSVGGTLDDIVRNIKSVQRAESENKEWVRSGLTPTYVSATSFTVAGDHRVDLPAGRRLKATISGATKYGTVLSSSYGASVTTVTVQWDLEEEIHAFSRVDANTVKFLGQDLRSTFAVNTRVQFWNDSKLSTQRKTRVVSSVSFSTNTTVVFTGGDPYETIDSSDDRVLVPSTGIDNTVSEVQFGTLTPDMYESGWGHTAETGSFQITANGSTGPFTINLPKTRANNTYVVQIQATSANTAPSNTNWVSPKVTSRSTTNFAVTLLSSITSGPVMTYDYCIVEQA